MSSEQFDVAIVGLGALGAATLYHLAKSGVKCIGFDRHDPPHNFGSSHGETRITRESIGEGAEYIPYVRRSHELWRSLEELSGTSILTICGALIVDSARGSSAHGVQNFAGHTAGLATEYSVPHQILEVGEAKERFPEFALTEGSLVYYEPGAGFVNPEVAIQVQLDLARQFGAVTLTNCPVLSVDSGPLVRFDGGSVSARRVLICAGNWANDFLPKPQFQVSRQVLHWLPIQSGSHRNGPVFIWCDGPEETDMIYGFPSLDGKTIKVATETSAVIEGPSAISREVSAAERQEFYEVSVRQRLPFVAGPAVRTSVCAYTVASGYKFSIADHPSLPGVVVASCCSGHGFKHSAAIGEELAARVSS